MMTPKELIALIGVGRAQKAVQAGRRYLSTVTDPYAMFTREEVGFLGLLESQRIAVEALAIELNIPSEGKIKSSSFPVPCDCGRDCGRRKGYCPYPAQLRVKTMEQSSWDDAKPGDCWCRQGWRHSKGDCVIPSTLATPTQITCNGTCADEGCYRNCTS